MVIDRKSIRWLIIILTALILFGCISIKQGYIQVLGLNDLDSAFESTIELVEQVGFEEYVCEKTKPKYKHSCYTYQILESHALGAFRREFFVSVWSDEEKKRIILFFGEANVSSFSTDGRSIFNHIIKSIQVNYPSNDVVFGSDRETSLAIRQELH